MVIDPLSSLLARFNVEAGTFFSGALCGITRFGEDGEESGHIHLLRQGRLKLFLADGSATVVDAPSLMCFPRVSPHRFEIEDGAEAQLTCASVRFEGGAQNPVAQAMPEVLILPLPELGMAQPMLEWLFAEAVEQDSGRMAVLNRLFELLMIQLLRHLLRTGRADRGMLAGLADVRLARVLDAIHAHPDMAWTLESMAETCGMSRARFAAHFKQVVAATPLDYLTHWRLTLAQQLLKADRPIKLVANEVGYESPSALARAFRRKLGVSPGEWLRAHRTSVRP